MWVGSSGGKGRKKHTAARYILSAEGPGTAVYLSNRSCGGGALKYTGAYEQSAGYM